MIKAHVGEPPTKLREGCISELSWETIKPNLEHAFRLRLGETITEVEPTVNGLRIKIEKR
jgi:hypothetical protein